jgi:hypothetical protein
MASRLLLMLWMFKQADLNLLSNFFIGADFNGDERIPDVTFSAKTGTMGMVASC